jgi:hypothetical protein
MVNDFTLYNVYKIVHIKFSEVNMVLSSLLVTL